MCTKDLNKRIHKLEKRIKELETWILDAYEELGKKKAEEQSSYGIPAFVPPVVLGNEEGLTYRTDIVYNNALVTDPGHIVAEPARETTTQVLSTLAETREFYRRRLEGYLTGTE